MYSLNDLNHLNEQAVAPITEQHDLDVQVLLHQRELGREYTALITVLKGHGQVDAVYTGETTGGIGHGHTGTVSRMAGNLIQFTPHADDALYRAPRWVNVEDIFIGMYDRSLSDIIKEAA
jgi:hypothetical protein